MPSERIDPLNDSPAVIEAKLILARHDLRSTWLGRIVWRLFRRWL